MVFSCYVSQFIVKLLANKPPSSIFFIQCAYWNILVEAIEVGGRDDGGEDAR